MYYFNTRDYKSFRNINKKRRRRRFYLLIFILSIILFILFVSIITIIVSVVSTIDIYAECAYNDTANESVEFLIPIIEESMEEHDISLEYENVIIAQLHQESGDDELILQTDPFQSSISYCGVIGCITDYETSVEAAMDLHRTNIDKFNELELEGEPTDTILQAYNYGTGYLEWLDEEGKIQSEQSAYEYSKKMTEENEEYGDVCPFDPEGIACYGDYKYVEHVKLMGEYTCGIEGGLTTLPEMAGTYKVTQEYGETTVPGEEGWHDGIDLAGADGAEVYATGDGEVQYSGQDGAGANVVILKHSDTLYTVYGHLKEPSDLVEGDMVSAGDVVGYQGNTGNSTGSHLHFEVRVSDSYEFGPEFTDDPELYLPIIENQMEG